MKVRIQPATRRDILVVLGNPSQATIEDIKVLGATPEQAIDYFTSRVPEADAVTFAVDGVAKAVLGWDKQPGLWFSWLITTPEILTRDPAPVVAARKHLIELAKRHQTVDLRSILGVANKPRSNWMKSLGFKQMFDPSGRLWRFVG